MQPPRPAPPGTTERPALPGRQLLPLAAGLASLALALALFHLLARGPLATPAVTDPSAWAGWAAARDPITVAFALLRLVVVAVGWYLVGVTTIGTAARLARAARLVRMADALTVPAVRRLLQNALGLGLATAVVGTANLPTPAPDSRIVVAAGAHGGYAQVLDGETLQLAAGGPDTVAMTVADSAGPTTAMRQATAEAPAPPPPAIWTTAPGQHFWAIAEQVLTVAWGHAPADAEVVPYWQRLIEANRHALADPGNPDLIFPGQVFRLPPPPPALGA